MWININAWLVGFIFGGIVTMLGFPLPAPNQLAGILGIIGVYCGYLLIGMAK